jgi:hypothetical protein
MTERRRSAMGALQVAIDDALAGNPAFVALVDTRVYSLGTVPKDPDTIAAAPYVELGDSAERATGYFGTGGNTNDETITIVTPRADGKPGAARVLVALMDALDGRRIPCDGHTVLSGRVELLTMFVDPDVAHIRTVCRYTAQSWTTQTA